MLRKVLTTVACAVVAVVVTGGPASAEYNTAELVQDSVDTGTRPTGACVGWGSTVTVTTVYNPLSPPDKLATLSVPLPTSVKAC